MDGIKFSPGCRCCTVDLCATVKGCNAITLGPGGWPYTLEVRQGGTLIGSAVSGCVPVPPNGTYDLTVISSRFNNGTATVTVTGGVYTTPTINLTPATGYHCCPTYAVPISDTLYVTDSTGTVTLVWDGVATWGVNGHTVPYTGTMTDYFTGGVCGACSNPASGTVGVEYSIGCTAPNVGQVWRQSACPAIPGPLGPFYPAVSTWDAGTNSIKLSWQTGGCAGPFPGTGGSAPAGSLNFSVLPVNATVTISSPITGATVVITE